MRERVSAVLTKLVAIAVLAIAAWILLRVVINAVVVIAWIVAAVVAVVGVLWALRTLRST